MCDFLEENYLELYNIVHKGPRVPTTKDDKVIITGPKTREQYNNKYDMVVQKNAKVNKISIYIIIVD